MKNSLAGKITVILISLLLIGGGICLLSASRPLWSGTVIPEEYRQNGQTGTIPEKYLITGVMNENGAALAEIVIVLSVDKENGQLDALYLPGFMYVGEDKVRYGRLSGAFNWGTDVLTGGGTPSVAECIYSLLCIQTDHYLSFDMKFLPQVVDLLGGISFTVHEDLHFEDRTLEAGGIEFGSKDVLRYILSDSRENVASVNALRAAFSESLLENLLNISSEKRLSLLFRCRNGTDTDLSVRELIELSEQLSGIGTQSFEFYIIPGSVCTGYGAENLSLWSVDRSAAAEVINSVFRKNTNKILEEDLIIPELFF